MTQATGTFVLFLIAGCVLRPGPETVATRHCLASDSANLNSARDARTPVGEFTLVQVFLSSGPESKGSEQRYHLSLRAPNSGATLATARATSPDTANGKILAEGVLTTVNSRSVDAVPAIIRDNRLYLRCRGCGDDAAFVGQIAASNAEGFSGQWTSLDMFKAGIDSVPKRELPNPRGRYCAYRDNASPEQPGR